MLVLSRKVGEKIVVFTPSGEIWLTLVDVDRGRARVGIDAPREWEIYRQELLGRDGKPVVEWKGE